MGTKRRSRGNPAQGDRAATVRGEPADDRKDESGTWGFDLTVEDEAFWATWERGGPRDSAEPDYTDFWPEEGNTDEGEATR
ncbi:MAG: hypothetical protein ABFD16_02275 [Thermoguttaceae bacterium]